QAAVRNAVHGEKEPHVHTDGPAGGLVLPSEEGTALGSLPRLRGRVGRGPAESHTVHRRRFSKPPPDRAPQPSKLGCDPRSPPPQAGEGEFVAAALLSRGALICFVRGTHCAISLTKSPQVGEGRSSLQILGRRFV